MKRLALSFLCFLVSEDDSRSEPPPLSDGLLVELCDTTGLELSILETARAETSGLFSGAGAHVHWGANCEIPPLTTPRSARIYVVPLIPEGIANRHREYRGRTHVMGYVLATPTEKRPGVIYVSRRAVEANASRSGRTNLTEAHLARALGRVFAHELAHRFLRAGHTKKGILKDSLDQEDLIGEESSALFFSSAQSEALRRLIDGTDRNLGEAR